MGAEDAAAFEEEDGGFFEMDFGGVGVFWVFVWRCGLDDDGSEMGDGADDLVG